MAKTTKRSPIPFAPLKLGAKVADEQHIRVYSPTGEYTDIWGVYLGETQTDLDTAEGKRIESLVGIRVTRPFTPTDDTYIAEEGDTSEFPNELFTDKKIDHGSLMKLQAKSKPIRQIPIGDTIRFPRYVVLIDASKRSGIEAIIHAPPPGSLPSDPLWPFSLVGEEGFPTHLSFVAGWVGQPRRYRYYGPEGLTGTFTGKFGFQLVIPSSYLTATTPDERYHLKKGQIPGAPMIYLTEDAPLPEYDPETFFPTLNDPRRDARAAPIFIPEHGKPALLPNVMTEGAPLPNRLTPKETAAQLDNQWVIMDEEDRVIVYMPPSRKGHIEGNKMVLTGWPSDLVNRNLFPDDATYANTPYRVKDHPAGPPLTARAVSGARFCDGRGFGAFHRTLEDEKRAEAFEVCTSPEKPLTFIDADRIRNTYAEMFADNVILSLHYTRLWIADDWFYCDDLAKMDDRRPEKDAIIDMISTIPDALRNADIVLWDKELAEEATGGEAGGAANEWVGKSLPAKLLRDTRRPQFHMMREGAYTVTGDQCTQWGMDIEGVMAGFLLVPIISNAEADHRISWRQDTMCADDEAQGIYACFIFTPKPGSNPQESHFTTAEYAFPRVRWTYPIMVGWDIKHAYGHVAAMLDFMTSPRIEFAPELYQEPDDEEESRLQEQRTKRRGRSATSRYITLRRVEVAPEVAALHPVESVSRGTLEEAHKVIEHRRKVRYGPGRQFVRYVKIESFQSPRDKPLAPDAEEALEKRREQREQTNFIKVVR